MRRAAVPLAGLLICLAGTVLGLDRLFPPNLTRLDNVSTEILDRTGKPIGYLPARGGVWRFRAAPDKVSPGFLRLLVSVEDRRFWWHPGVDPVALGRAAAQWARAGHVVSGGSTIAMQAARLLEPRPRTFRSKLIEMARALQLQARYGREGVLRIWLTLAPFGGNIEGVRAASLAWFGADPTDIEPAEAALLVALPRRPEALRPDRHPAAAEAIRARVMASGIRAGLFTGAPMPPVPTARLPFVRHAPQVLADLPRVPLVATTLDLPMQVALERLAQDRLETLPPRASLALLVVDAQTREIRAIYPGAWGDRDRSGALDLTRAVRSPGSALKPFIYAMAFEDGIASPDTVVADLPRRFGDYAPENFDRGFAGSITAGEALRRSLNLPAVALLDRVGPLRFAAVLKAGGIPLHLQDDANPSLPLALGGEGVTPRQAAGLYAALATDGTAAPPCILAGEPLSPVPMLQPEAARMVAAVLNRPFPGGGPPGIAWKTGTSWGGRDAWAFGADARHVVAVWIGRPDGTPLPGATGTALALPVLARIFDMLPPAPRGDAWQPRPRTALGAADAADALRLLFPPPGAVIAQAGRVTIRAMGGVRPLTFLVDDRPVAAEPARRETSWQAPGPGFYSVTVLDARGAAAHAAIEVR